MKRSIPCGRAEEHPTSCGYTRMIRRDEEQQEGTSFEIHGDKKTQISKLGHHVKIQAERTRKKGFILSLWIILWDTTKRANCVCDRTIIYISPVCANFDC
jgi:hypothetical protein